MEKECDICGEQLSDGFHVIPADDQAFTQIIGKSEKTEIVVCPECKHKYEDALNLRRRLEAIQSNLQKLYSTKNKRCEEENVSVTESAENVPGRKEPEKHVGRLTENSTSPRKEKDTVLYDNQHGDSHLPLSQEESSEHSSTQEEEQQQQEDGSSNRNDQSGENVEGHFTPFDFERETHHHHPQLPKATEIPESEEDPNCKYCGEKCDDIKNLYRHFELYHRDERPFTCPYCPKRFRLKQNARSHLKIHVGPWDHVCVSCGKGFTTKHNLASHLKNHPDGRCKKIIIGKAELDYLRRKRYQKDSFVQIKSFGDDCTSVMMKQLPDVASEMNTNELVASQTKGNASLGDRVEEEDCPVKASVMGISCKECGKGFGSEELLRIHLENVHQDVRKFVCLICDKRYKTKDYLKSHMKTHTGERNFFCDFCEKGFIHKGGLNHHNKMYPNGGCKRNQKILLNEEQLRSYGFDKLVKNQSEIECKESMETSTDDIVEPNAGNGEDRGEKQKGLKPSETNQTSVEENVPSGNISPPRPPKKTPLERQFLGNPDGKREEKLLNSNEVENLGFESKITGPDLELGDSSMVKSPYVITNNLEEETEDIEDLEMNCDEATGGSENIENSDEMSTNLKHFDCDICLRRFTRKDHLKKHLKIHTNERNYVCESCDKGFITNSQLTKHLKTHPGGTCKTFKKIQLSREQIEAHGFHRSETAKTCIGAKEAKEMDTSKISNEKGEDEFAFDADSTSTQNVLEIEGALNKNINIKTELITDGYSEDGYSDLGNVGVKEEFSSLYLCFVCNYQFTSCKSLAAHRRDVHNEKKPFQCNLCQEKYEHYLELIEHKREYHGDKLHKCLLCKETFLEKSALRKHLLINPVGACRRAVVSIEPIPEEYSEQMRKEMIRYHEQFPAVKKYVEEEEMGTTSVVELPADNRCPYCQNKLANKDTLRKHIRNVHTDIRPFRCQKCGKHFKRSDHLRDHLLIHKRRENVSGSKEDLQVSKQKKEVSTECPHCDKVLANKDCLRKHIFAVHTNIRPYRCDKCGKSFLRKDYLAQHLATHEVSRKYGNKSKPKMILNTKCMYCEKQLKNRDSLKKHVMTVHTNKRPFKCDLCSKAFKRSDHLEDHKTTHTLEKKHKCENCGKGYSYLLSLKKHHIKFPDGTCAAVSSILSCEECEKVFPNNYKLQQHLKKHAGQRDFKCDKCGKAFFEKGNLKKHLMIHNEEKKFLCTVCGAQFMRKTGLETHMITHSQEKPHPCLECGLRFPYVTSLRRHMRTQHCNERPYKCQDCGKSFKQLNNLNVHRRQHTGERPYGCETCGERFMYRGAFTQHMRTHTGAKPYKCDQCPEAFSKYYTLQTHRRTHTGERPLSCLLCNMTFAQRSSLKRHEQTHTNEKLQLCSICGVGFTRRGTLEKHIRSHAENAASFPDEEFDTPGYDTHQTQVLSYPANPSIDSENNILEPSLMSVVPYVGTI